MAIFDIFKKKKDKPAEAPPALSSTPTEQVLAMRQQGLTNNQIIQQLQRQSFSSSQIFDAMNQADVAGREIPSSYFKGAEQPPGPQPPAQQPFPTPNIQQSPPPMQDPTQDQAPEPQEDYTEKIEETVESIIDEKWEELVKDIGKIVEWKNKIESRITAIEQEFKDLKSGFENLHKAIIGKIGEYDKNILNVGTEIKAMERVFQKILPKMTENVNELSRITKGIKTKKK